MRLLVILQKKGLYILFTRRHMICNYFYKRLFHELFNPLKKEAQTALFKDPVRTAQ